MRNIFFVFIFAWVSIQAQTPKTLLVYVECNVFCRTDFLQEKLPFLEFSILPNETNVHVLITQQSQIGQQEVQMDFLGLKNTLTYF